MHTYCTRDSSCFGSDIRLGSWSVSTCHMSKYTSANSCVDSVNTERDSDFASRLMCGDPRLSAFL